LICQGLFEYALTKDKVKMNVFQTAFREIMYRKLNFLLGIFAAAVAVSCVTCGILLLKRFDQRTEQLVAEKEEAAEIQMIEMEDEYRRITKKMGFNIFILPKNQNLADFYDKNYASKFMPEAYAQKLSDAKGIATIRHLLPMLQMKVEWPETKRRILLIGVRGEMPWAHRTNKAPILKEVPTGGAAIGYELYNSLNLKKGDTITFMGKSFKVNTLKPERGTIDDITMWIPLKDAQELFNKKGLINAMLALECSCAWSDLPKIRIEIQKILPNTQVLEFAGKALARAEARWTATKNAKLLVTREKESRAKLRTERESLISLLAPLAVAGSAIWMALLALANVRERRIEIGLFRALGVRTGRLLSLFLVRAVLTGFTGAMTGCIATFAIFIFHFKLEPSILVSNQFITFAEWMLFPICATLIAGLACWLPALLATRIDPAEILREE
jgi:putative ABC transport system permease protein